MTELKNQLKDFIVDYNIIGISAGVSIGLVTKDAISSLVGDVIIPLLVIILKKIKNKTLISILPIKSEFNFINFIRQFISFVLILIFTFLFIQTFFIKFIGAKKQKTKNIDNSGVTI